MPLQDTAADLIAYDDAGQVLLMAECKGKFGTTEEWATRFRSNLLADTRLARAPFFLIATADRIY